jgi:chromosome segregation ATPase
MERLRQHAHGQESRAAELSTAVAKLHEDLAASKEALQAALTAKASAQHEAAMQADDGSRLQLRKDLEAKEYEALHATRQLAECTRKCDELQRTLEVVTANERAATSRCLALEEDLRTLRQELVTVRSSERHAQQEVDHLRNQVRDLQGVLASLREETSATRQEHQREVASLQHGYDEMRAQLRSKDHELASLRTELQTSRAAESALLRDLERERAAATAREREHATSLANVREELALCRVELRSNIDHSLSLQGLQDEVKRLNADILAKTMQIREVELDKQEAVRQMKVGGGVVYLPRFLL